MDNSDDPSSAAPAPVNGADIKAENRRPAIQRPSTRHRSRITNRNKLLPSISGTSVWARIVRDTMDAMIVHLGGEDQVSETAAHSLSPHRGAGDRARPHGGRYRHAALRGPRAATRAARPLRSARQRTAALL